jgi:hypothetical protein
MRAGDKEICMLEKLSVILIILWALGFFALNAGGMIHIILPLVASGLILRRYDEPPL